MEKERDTQAIYFKDLLFAALYQWRRILLVALIFAVVLGAVKFFQNRANSTAVTINPSTAEKIAKLEQEMEEINNEISKQETYLAESVLMSLDPYSIYKAGMDFYVKTDYQILPGMTYQNPESTKGILRAYKTLLDDNEIMDTVAENLGMQGQYLWELLSVGMQTDDSRSMYIVIRYSDPEGAEKILNEITKCFEAAKPQIEQSLGAHEISIVTFNTDVRMDLDLVNIQNNANQRLETLLTNRGALQKEIDALQPAVAASTNPVAFAIIGAVLGAFAVAGLAWINHIATDKVYSERMLKNRTDIKVLGCVPKRGKRASVDQWLRKLENRTIGDTQEHMEILAVNIRNYCEGVERLLLAGDCDAQLRVQLCKVLTNMGIQSDDYGSLLKDKKALEELPKCDAVLLIEQCGQSKYSSVIRSMERIGDQNKQLLGCVLVDG